MSRLLRRRAAWLLAVFAVAGAAGGCDPRLFDGADAKSPEKKVAPAAPAAPAVKEGDKKDDDDDGDSFGGPFAAMSALGALSKGSEPGPFEEQNKGGDHKEGAPYAAILTLSGEVSELEAPFELGLSTFTGGGGEVTGLRNLTVRLGKLDADANVNAVLIRFRNPSMSLAVAEELRDALAAVKKPVECHFESGGNIDVLLLSACKKVTLAPAGSLAITGPAAAPMYYKGVLELLGVQADFIHIGEFKGAAEPYTRSEPSPAMRQTYNDLIDGAYTRMVGFIATGRKIDQAKVVAWIDQALFDAEQAQKAGIVDEILPYEAWRDAHGAWKKVKIEDKKAGGGDLFAMLGLKPKKRPSGPRVALIYAVGQVVDGPGSATGAFKEIASGKLAPAFYAAAADDDIKAVVLRIDSPGGSALASDVIWQAVRACAAKKPVIVSMGSLAASGGYYIPSAGHRIFAQPDTLTGSIGVIAGKMVIAPALGKVGVTSVEIGKGKRSHLMSALHKWTADEKKALADSMESVYVTFKERVAEGRKIKPEAVEPNAQGRVFTGAEALKRGLVDELGGLDDALAYARQQVKLGDDSPVEVYPREPSLLDMLGGFGVSAPSSLSVMARGLVEAPLGPAAAAEVARALDLLSHFAGGSVRAVVFVTPIR